MMDGRVLVVTPDHCWRTVACGWIRTDELRPGELIDGFVLGEWRTSNRRMPVK
ncbi:MULTISPECIES: hypothetical protein [Myxococcus]|uniref:hypothetical protein n=1 Tax=Myxococcus TaxID=32 RepID=UPI001FE6141F|nr:MULTISPECIES: hypothetical protein [Myxococcus]